jgi:hypothetical protein
LSVQGVVVSLGSPIKGPVKRLKMDAEKLTVAPKGSLWDIEIKTKGMTPEQASMALERLINGMSEEFGIKTIYAHATNDTIFLEIIRPLKKPTGCYLGLGHPQQWLDRSSYVLAETTSIVPNAMGISIRAIETGGTGVTPAPINTSDKAAPPNASVAVRVAVKVPVLLYVCVFETEAVEPVSGVVPSP